MQTILTVLQLFLSLGLIGLVLIQHGRGADAGAAFGSGASATVFGSRGSGSFLSRATAVIAALFFVTSIALGYYSAQAGKAGGLMEGVEPTTMEQPPAPVTEIPAIPVPGAGGAVPIVPSGVPEIPAVPSPAASETGGAGDVPPAPADGGPADEGKQ
jgi:preprotein translocase subunit SecG